jgi:putative aldouronate transport system permease protein
VAGYVLSRDDLPGAGFIMKAFVFTMYFQGGTIPFYILINNLGLMNTRFLMIIVSCITVYNIILVRSFCASSLPRDLWEAASIDGCSNIRYVFQMVFPLSKAIIAVIALYIAVGYWNSYFWPMIFLSDASKLPLQNVLREILLVANMNTADTGTDPVAAQRLQQMASVIKYSAIVVSTVPIICVYPFIQKYFVQGVMIGSLKG